MKMFALVLWLLIYRVSYFWCSLYFPSSMVMIYSHVSQIKIWTQGMIIDNYLILIAYLYFSLSDYTITSHYIYFHEIVRYILSFLHVSRIHRIKHALDPAQHCWLTTSTGIPSSTPASEDSPSFPPSSMRGEIMLLQNSLSTVLEWLWVLY